MKRQHFALMAASVLGVFGASTSAEEKCAVKNMTGIGMCSFAPEVEHGRSCGHNPFRGKNRAQRTRLNSAFASF